MARKDLLKIAFVAVLTMAASSAYAATINATTDLGGGSFTPSNKVTITVATDGTSGSFNGTAYGAFSKHDAGDKIIGTNSGDPKLYFKTTAVTATTPAASSNQTFDTSWTSM